MTGTGSHLLITLQREGLPALPLRDRIPTFMVTTIAKRIEHIEVSHLIGVTGCGRGEQLVLSQKFAVSEAVASL